MDNKDKLITLIAEAIKDNSNPNEDGGELINRVVDSYINDLFQFGYIPSFALSEVIEDIEIEAVNIYRKLTYGYYDLKEYRMKRCEVNSSGNSEKN